MNEQEKSLKLAELMEWETRLTCIVKNAPSSVKVYADKESGIGFAELQPYSKEEIGLSQFAAILLKFPEVMEFSTEWTYNKPTQANILNEILRMNGVEI